MNNSDIQVIAAVQLQHACPVPIPEQGMHRQPGSKDFLGTR